MHPKSTKFTFKTISRAFLAEDPDIVAVKIALLKEFHEIMSQLLGGLPLQDVHERLVAREFPDCSPDLHASRLSGRQQRTTRLIKEIEEWFDCEVLSISQKSVGGRTPTAEGKAVFDAVDEFISRYDALFLGRKRRLKIATIDAGAQFWLPPVLQLPKVQSLVQNSFGGIDITTCEWWEVLRSVRNGDADIGIATEVGEPPLERIPILRRPHVFVVGKSNPLSSRRLLEWEELDGQTIVCLGSFIAVIDVEKILRDCGLLPQIVTVSTCSQVLTMAQHGVGIGVVTPDMVINHTGLAIVPIAGENYVARDAIFVRGKAKDDSASFDLKPICQAMADYWHGWGAKNGFPMKAKK